MLQKRTRIALALSILTAGCTALINVPDLELQDADDAGRDGSAAQNDGSAAQNDGSATQDDGSTGGEGGACSGANLQTDSNNCGTCAHSCAGGACQAGVCQPVTLADHLYVPWGIDVDDTYVYFTQYNLAEDPADAHPSVNRTKKDGSQQTPDVIANDIHSPVGVKIDGTTLYWASYDGVERCDFTGGTIASCVGTRVKIAENEATGDQGFGPKEVKTYQGKVYWADMNGSVYRSLPDGGTKQKILSDVTDPWGIALGGGYVFVTSAETVLETALVDGGAQMTGGPENSYYYASYVAADDVGYFWSYIDYDDTTQGVIYGGSTATRTGAAIASKQATGLAWGVAIDSQYVYWTDEGSQGVVGAAGDGKLLRCPRAGCNGAAPTVLANGLFGGGPIALDGTFIYWVENNYENGGDTGLTGARIRRIAK